VCSRWFEVFVYRYCVCAVCGTVWSELGVVCLSVYVGVSL